MKTKREFYEEYLKKSYGQKVLLRSTIITTIVLTVIFVIVKYMDPIPVETIIFLIGINAINIGLSFVFSETYQTQTKHKAMREKNILEEELKSIHKKIIFKKADLDGNSRLEPDNKYELGEEDIRIAKIEYKYTLEALEKRRDEIEFKLEIIGEDPIMDR